MRRAVIMQCSVLPLPSLRMQSITAVIMRMQRITAVIMENECNHEHRVCSVVPVAYLSESLQVWAIRLHKAVPNAHRIGNLVEAGL